MSTATLEANHTLRCRLAAEAVESETGVIRGCTVAKAGVQATGKFVMLDAAGAITRDEEQCKSRLPVFTDAKTLDTLMTAAKAAGKRVKMREDHDDSVGARAGYVADFKRITSGDEDRVVTDLHIFKSYRNRNVMLETAQETPEEIGLSIDFTPSFELAGDRALMRVSELHAVDIVDEGAITPDGLLLSAGVDSVQKSESDKISDSNPPEKMASPSLEEIMASVSALAASLKECQAGIAKLSTPPATPTPDPAAMAAVNELKTQLAAQAETSKANTAAIAQMKKEKALLGFRGTEAEKIALSAAPIEDIEKLTQGKKSFLQLVDERVASAKCKRSEANLWVMKNHRAEYAEHLSAKGIFDPAKATMKVA